MSKESLRRAFTILFALVGNLTVHGVTRSTTWTVRALAATDVQYW